MRFELKHLALPPLWDLPPLPSLLRLLKCVLPNTSGYFTAVVLHLRAPFPMNVSISWVFIVGFLVCLQEKREAFWGTDLSSQFLAQRSAQHLICTEHKINASERTKSSLNHKNSEDWIQWVSTETRKWLITKRNWLSVWFERSGHLLPACLSSHQIKLPELQREACQRTTTLAPVSQSYAAMATAQRYIRKITKSGKGQVAFQWPKITWTFSSGSSDPK